jgi:hypothetical protein
MSTVLGFDVYGTLVDPFGMEKQLVARFGQLGRAICACGVKNSWNIRSGED